MIVAIHQPQYMPWLGYFDKMDQADCFVLLDSVQFKKNEWQNRNRIKTAQGSMWLTVPVTYRFPARILEVGVNANVNWRHKHLQALRTNYAGAPHWQRFSLFLEKFYERDWEDLTSVNRASIEWLKKELGIGTDLHVASQMEDLSEEPTRRLVDICRRFDADIYLAGAGGREYMDMDCFAEAGIEVRFQEYDPPLYPQLFGDFVSHLSTLDLVFNCGLDSLDVLRRGRRGGD